MPIEPTLSLIRPFGYKIVRCAPRIKQSSSIPAVVAEWLRLLTRNQFPSGSIGSNPTDCEIFRSFENYLDWMTFKLIVSLLHTASSGNRTRAARVAGEHSTTEPTMPCILDALKFFNITNFRIFKKIKIKNFAVGRIRTYAPRGKLISSQSP